MDYEKFSFRERYNEIMFDERDIIEKFLKDQYDIRYGRQRDTWHFEPAIEVIAHNGSLVQIHDIKLDTDKFVVFNVEAFCEKNVEWECCDFAYGELSKVIESLPNADDIKWDMAVCDIKWIANKYSVDQLLHEHQFKYEIGSKQYALEDIKVENGGLALIQALGNDEPITDLPCEVVVSLRDHLNIASLHGSKEYKKLTSLLALRGNTFACSNYGDATFAIESSDMTFDVSSVLIEDGKLVIYGSDIDDEYFEPIRLDEKEIRAEYLQPIIDYMECNLFGDIIGTYNGHNAELVRKINDAWKSVKYHNRFSEILLALLVRDHEEYLDKYCEIEDYSGDWAMEHAHEIMEGVCDDWDLETILSFIRYK